ncbi:MAG: efflux RND transporter periplasmic adaptor subunit [Pseudomonadota bacterium]
MPCRSAAPATKIAVFFAAVLASSPSYAEVDFDCVVQPNRTIVIGSPVTGILSEVEVSRGDRVEEGQLLARLESDLETATVALSALRAKDDANIVAQDARLTLLREREERAKALLERGTATRDTYEQAQAELAIAEAELRRLEVEREIARLELKRAEVSLERRSIYSKVDGLVTRSDLSAGEFVSQDASILHIADLDPLHIEAFLPIGYFDQIKVGATAQVALRQPAGEVADVVVDVVDSVFDASSDTFGVRLLLPNPDLRLPAGQRCKVLMDLAPIERDGTGLLVD